MLIAVKYCGGCNPRFDRTEVVRRLQLEFPFHTVQTGAGDSPADLAVVVCGCPSQCASHENFTGSLGKLVLYLPEQYETLRDLILELDKEKSDGLEDDL